MPQTKIRVLFVNDNHCIMDHKGLYFLGSSFHLFLKGFICTRPVLSTPCVVKSNLESTEHIIDGVTVWIRTGYGTAADFYYALPRMLLHGIFDLWRHVGRADVVFIAFPACFGFLSYSIARLLHKPICAYIVGDVYEVVDRSRRYPGLQGALARIAARWEWSVTCYVARRVPTFALGRSLQSKLLSSGVKAIPAMTSLIKRIDVRPPRIQEQLAHVRLGTVCRLSLEKGIQNLFHAVSRLLTRGIDVSCVVAGAGPLLNDLIRLARELGISERVVLNGAVPHSEIDRFLTSEVDVFVLPSLSEGVPKVVLEAMAAGIPIVATAVGGIPEMLGESGERGWLVPAGDVSALADAIESCVKDTDERVKRCEEAHKYVIDHTLEAEAGRIEAVILGLIAKD